MRKSDQVPIFFPKIGPRYYYNSPPPETGNLKNIYPWNQLNCTVLYNPSLYTADSTLVQNY